MTQSVKDAHIDIFEPLNDSWTDPDKTIPQDDIVDAETSERINERKDVASFTIRNNRGEYSGENDVELKSGQRMTFNVSLESDIKFWGENTWGSGSWGGTSLNWTGKITDVNYVFLGPAESRIEIEAEDFVFSVMSDRKVYNNFENESIAGSRSSILNTILRNDVPEINQDWIRSFTDEKTSMNINGKDALEASIELTRRANAVMFSRRNRLHFKKLQDIEPEFEVRGGDVGYFSLTKSDNDMVNRVRVNGGSSTAKEDGPFDEDSTPNSYIRVTESNRITFPVETRKSELGEIDIWIRRNQDSSDNLSVRLQKSNSNGDGPININDESSDIASRTLSEDFLSDNSYNTFIMPGHTLPEPNPWVIIEAEGGDGHDIGIDGKLKDFSPENISVQTVSAKNIDEEEAKLTGDLVSIGEFSEVETSFHIREIGSTEWDKVGEEIQTEETEFSIIVDHLTEATEYEFKAIVQNTSDGDIEDEGNVLEFTTSSSEERRAVEPIFDFEEYEDGASFADINNDGSIEDSWKEEDEDSWFATSDFPMIDENEEESNITVYTDSQFRATTSTSENGKTHRGNTYSVLFESPDPDDSPGLIFASQSTEPLDGAYYVKCDFEREDLRLLKTKDGEIVKRFSTDFQFHADRTYELVAEYEDDGIVGRLRDYENGGHGEGEILAETDAMDDNEWDGGHLGLYSGKKAVRTRFDWLGTVVEKEGSIESEEVEEETDESFGDDFESYNDGDLLSEHEYTQDADQFTVTTEASLSEDGDLGVEATGEQIATSRSDDSLHTKRGSTYKCLVEFTSEESKAGILVSAQDGDEILQNGYRSILDSSENIITVEKLENGSVTNRKETEFEEIETNTTYEFRIEIDEDNLKSALIEKESGDIIVTSPYILNEEEYTDGYFGLYVDSSESVYFDSISKTLERVGQPPETNPLFIAYYKFDITVRKENSTSKNKYRRRDGQHKDDSIRSISEAQDIAVSKLNHYSKPDKEWSGPAESFRMHSIDIAEVIELNFPRENAVGEYIITERSDVYEGNKLETEVTAQEVSTI